MGDFKSFVTGLYNTVKPEFRARIFYGNEDSALDILTSICESAIVLVSETNLKFCFFVYVDTWMKTHVKDAQLAKVKAVLIEKYYTTSAEITDKTIDKSLEIIFSHEEKLAKRLVASVAEKPLSDAVIRPNLREKLPEEVKSCDKSRTKIIENDVQSSTPALSIPVPADNETSSILPENAPKSSDKQLDELTEMISEQPEATSEIIPKQSEQSKQPEQPETAKPKPIPERPLPSPKTEITPIAKAESAAPQRGVALAASSAQKFPLRLVIIVSSALVIITVGVILALVLANGGGNGVTIPDTASFMASAEKYLLEMNYEQAVLEFNKILEIDPMNVDAYLGKAEALIAMGKTDEARELLETAYTKTGNPQIFDKLQSLIEPPASASSEDIGFETSDPIEIEPKDPIYQDPMCLAIEKTLTDYLNGKPITDITNFDKVTDLYILGTKVYVTCGKRYGTGRMKSWGLSPDKISYSLYTDNSSNYVSLEETSGSLTDISFIKEMNKLKKLHIDSQRKLKDISPLSGMTSIKNIVLDRNGIVDISPLENMTQLTNLHLFHNSISDISAVKNMKNLVTLYFGNNKVTDISAVAGLTELRNLWIEENPIHDISAVSELTLLSQFVAGECGFSDISALSKLTSLEDVSLEDNHISDITALANCTNIEKLYLSKNNINNVFALSKLTNLTSLSLDNNRITDISALSNLTKLERLRLGYNNISSISSLSKLTSLEYLSMPDNKLSDISVLSNLTKLESLWLYSNNISDISPVSNLTNLTTLYLGGNPIYNISPLYKLTKMETLSLWGNYASEADVEKLGKALGIEINYWQRHY